MKTFNLLEFAVKTLKNKLAVFSLIGIIIASSCLCFSQAAYNTVKQEKSLPCELLVLSNDAKEITTGTIAKISEISGVSAVSALIQIPVSIKKGRYKAELTLNAVSEEYLTRPFLKGDVFPKSSAVPYLVLNEEACKKFVYEDTTVSGNNTSIDFMNGSFLLNLSEQEKAVSARICGILSSEKNIFEQEPEAYVSLSAAKELLRKSGRSTEIMSALVRVTNNGKAADVSNKLDALELAATNSNKESEERWNAMQRESIYLAILGMFSLVCSLVLFGAWRKIFDYEQKAVDCDEKCKQNPDSLCLMQSLIISAAGSAAGFLLSVCLPLFLPLELAESTVFFLPVLPQTAVFVVAFYTAFVFASKKFKGLRLFLI